MCEEATPILFLIGRKYGWQKRMKNVYMRKKVDFMIDPCVKLQLIQHGNSRYVTIHRLEEYLLHFVVLIYSSNRCNYSSHGVIVVVTVQGLNFPSSAVRRIISHSEVLEAQVYLQVQMCISLDYIQLSKCKENGLNLSFIQVSYANELVKWTKRVSQ